MMSVWLFLLPYLFPFFSFPVSIQEKGWKEETQFNQCASDDVHRIALVNDEKYRRKFIRIEKIPDGTVGRRALVTLPIVIHIVHDGGVENISLSQAQQSIQYLNQAFANTGYYDQGTGVNTMIQFCLARRTPDNLPTSGINRVQSTLTEFNYNLDDLTLKNLSRWNPQEYINIWVVKEICNSNGCGVAGYAYYPSAHGRPFDGIVVEARYFGSSPANTSVLVHEMGHYLGLYHTFQGGCSNNDCLLEGDRVCDTPPDNTTAHAPCNYPSNSCSTDADSGLAVDLPDMINNYMDYSSFGCYNAFTQGQSDRMNYFIQNVRNSLLTSNGCNDPCPAVVDASFSPVGQTINIGSTLNFINNSLNASSFQWKINGTVFSNQENPSFYFDTEGNFTITLLALSGNSLCAKDSFAVNFNVICPVVVNFSADTYSATPGNAINFQNNSQNASIYEWTVNKAIRSTAPAFIFSSNVEGIFEICLKASSPFCSDEYCYYVEVTDTTDCGNSLIHMYGTDDFDEGANNLILSSDGNFLLCGYKGDSTVIIKTTISGNVLWQKSFDFLANMPDVPRNFFLDNEGYLVGTGWGGTGNDNLDRGFIFKFDPDNQQLLWAKATSPNPGNRFLHCKQIPGSGNYLVSGRNYENNCDLVLLEFDKNTGIRTGNFLLQYGIGSCEDIIMVEFDGNSIYGVGRYNYAGGGTNKMRGTLAKFNLQGEMIWSRYYIADLGKDARLYNQNVIIENNQIYSIHYGDKNGTNLNRSVLFLVNTDMDGIPQWAYEYQLPNNGFNCLNFISSPDGFYLLCLDQNNRSLIIMKTTKRGEIIWAKSFNDHDFTASFGNNMLISGSNIFFSCGIIDNGNENMFVAKIGLDGNFSSNDCYDIEEPSVLSTFIPNVYQDDSVLNEKAENSRTVNSNVQVHNPRLIQSSFCTAPCPEDCSNTLDDDGDGLVDCMDPDCFCLGNCEPADATITVDSVSCGNIIHSVYFTLCNEGELSLPDTTPVSIYLNSPLQHGAFHLQTFQLGSHLMPGECIQISRPVSLSNDGWIYILANADNSPQPPYSLETDFPITGIQECIFTNNIDSSFVQNFPPPAVNLGPDITMCENGVRELNATPGFPAYRWQDGSTESSFTADGPGTYWVCVYNECGQSDCDTITISVNPASILSLGSDLTICPGDSVYVQANPVTYDRFQWVPEASVSCDDCPGTYIKPLQSGTYVLVAETNLGCVSVDSVDITVQREYITNDTSYFCTGDTLLIFGNPVTQEGLYQQDLQTVHGCDSTINIEVIAIEDTARVNRQLELCEGDTIILNGQIIASAGNYTYINDASSCVIIENTHVTQIPAPHTHETRFTCQGQPLDIFGQVTDTPGDYSRRFATSSGCDSIHTIRLEVADTFYHYEEITICSNEHADIFGTMINTPGTYRRTMSTTEGCDSTLAIRLSVLDTVATAESMTICPGDSALIFNDFKHEAGIYTNTSSALNGCDSTHAVELNLAPSITLEISAQPSCEGGSNGEASVMASGGIPPFSYLWSNADTTSVSDSLVAGDYLITVTDAMGCQQVTLVTVEDLEELQAESQAEPAVCFGENTGRIEIVTPGTGYEFSLDGLNFQTQAVFDSLHAGDYTVFVRDNRGCETILEVVVAQPPPLWVSLPPDTTINLGDSIALYPAFSGPAQHYSWQPPDGLSCLDCPAVAAGPVTTTTYFIETTDSLGCLAVDSIQIRVQATKGIYIPNAFSPNDDGINDFFTIYSDISVRRIITLKIFDRWGNFIWEGNNFAANDESSGWDGTFRGKKLSPAVFAYYAEVEFLNGSVSILKGDLTLMK